MKKISTLIILSLVALSCINNDGKASDSSIIHKGDAVPAFTIWDVNQANRFDSKENTRTALIYFLWSECGDCLKQTPEVLKLWKEIQDNDDLRLLCIARGGSNASKVQAELYWQSLAESETAPQIMPPLYYDTDRMIYNQFAISTVPRLYIVNGEGLVTWISSTLFTPYDVLKERLLTAE